MAWDRYAGLLNNPVRYNDPTGHSAEDGDEDPPIVTHDEEDGICIEAFGYRACSGQFNAANGLSILAFSADVTGALLSNFEAATVDIVGAGIIGAGCATGVGCAPAIAGAWSIDYGVTTVSPLGGAENFTGGLGFVATFLGDIELGNTSISSNGLAIGNDTLVSGRNLYFGVIPEANVDALVSNSQLKYDLDRYLGNKPGGSWVSTGTDMKDVLSDTASLFLQFFFNDW